MKFSDTFYFTKSDRTVLTWLVIVAAFIFAFFYFAGEGAEDEGVAVEKTEGGEGKGGSGSEGVGGERNGQKAYGQKYNGANAAKGNRDNGFVPARIIPPQLHPFDLNEASPDELLDLGFSEREVSSVMNYRARGGTYRHVEQMSRIAGMSLGKYKRLAPYFRVGKDYLPASDFVKMPKPKAGYISQKASAARGEAQGDAASHAPEDVAYAAKRNKLKLGETVPLNASDTTALMRIPGVGPTYSRMIVNYRERLGGFYSIDQLNDLQAVPYDVQQYLRLDSVPLRKIKVNRLPVNRLISHPYLSYYKALAIVNHIRQKGKLRTIHELRLNKNFPEADILRLEPYLDYTE